MPAESQLSPRRKLAAGERRIATPAPTCDQQGARAAVGVAGQGAGRPGAHPAARRAQRAPRAAVPVRAAAAVRRLPADARPPSEGVARRRRHRLPQTRAVRLLPPHPRRSRRSRGPSRDQGTTMSLTATAHSTGDTLRQDVLIDGHHRLITDEPPRLGGTDRGPAPHELLPAALAACIATTIRTYARTKDWALGELSIEVVYDNTSTPRHFDVTINLPDDLSARAGAPHHARRRDLPRQTRNRSRHELRRAPPRRTRSGSLSPERPRTCEREVRLARRPPRPQRPLRRNSHSLAPWLPMTRIPARSGFGGGGPIRSISA